MHETRFARRRSARSFPRARARRAALNGLDGQAAKDVLALEERRRLQNFTEDKCNNSWVPGAQVGRSAIEVEPGLVPIVQNVQAVQFVEGDGFGRLTAENLARHSRNQKRNQYSPRRHEGHEGRNYFNKVTNKIQR